MAFCLSVSVCIIINVPHHSLSVRPISLGQSLSLLSCVLSPLFSLSYFYIAFPITISPFHLAVVNGATCSGKEATSRDVPPLFNLDFKQIYFTIPIIISLALSRRDDASRV